MEEERKEEGSKLLKQFDPNYTTSRGERNNSFSDQSYSTKKSYNQNNRESSRGGRWRAYSNRNSDFNRSRNSNDEDKNFFQNQAAEEIARSKQRALRFSNDDKKFEKQREYGFVSRGEDNRLQKSSNERESYFKQILMNFIEYCSSNTSSTLSDKISHFIEKDELSELTADTNNSGESLKHSITIDTILNSLRKLREALLFAIPNEFSKKVFLFSIRISAAIGHHQTYIPCIMYLLSYYKANKESVVTMEEVEEITTLLVLHLAHFNNSNSKALRLYFEYLHKIDNSKTGKTFEVLQSWIYRDYYSWMKHYNMETDNAKASIMKFGLSTMVKHVIDCVSKSYFTITKHQLEQTLLPRGYTYESLVESYNLTWKGDEKNNQVIIVRDRTTRK
ncbi:predicted protein [Scheffersomyces stipitis CBS 6054]|uniref:Uncharacterized protein n=1 Tax=Scheffersomyces stipitis (strain ATCC 58785 / CBS 6054 / NBRC 10063 / NRRL Y-11545) TaxID=322104 RepID=A3GH65_PICST|nr:predicted protein [Scheffersomyces stipitis CBS 6054]EAZ62997.2 predicted protein [Scheffersomyces stipitis CBS 6054]KAG2735403.1 hypothetical protein G9P44_001617 [Scheffersomyces stipitis]